MHRSYQVALVEKSEFFNAKYLLSHRKYIVNLTCQFELNTILILRQQLLA